MKNKASLLGGVLIALIGTCTYGQIQAPPVADPPGSVAWSSQDPLPIRPPVFPDVSVTETSGADRDSTGLIPARRAGLSASLWRGGDTDRALVLLENLPLSPYPGSQELLFRVLLAEALPPLRDDDTVLLARIDALLARGALEQAQSLIERSGPDTPDLFRRWFDISLLTGSEDRACAALEANLNLAPDQPSKVFCLARSGRWLTAALMLDSGHALADISDADHALLERFLDPELFEEAAPLTRPTDPTALQFRLYEAIGEPLATRDLSLAFAWSDLRFVAGWKAQLDAAERLSRSGALPGNRLLGLYTERRAAASGGVWERVKAVQALDIALNSGDDAAVGPALINADQVMAAIGLETALAEMFAPRLGRLRLTGGAEAVAARLLLLAGIVPDTIPLAATDLERLAHALLADEPVAGLSDTPVAAAMTDAFEAEVLPFDTAQAEAIFAALTLLTPDSEADLGDRTAALRLLRGAGQDGPARRIAADMLLLGEPRR